MTDTTTEAMTTAVVTTTELTTTIEMPWDTWVRIARHDAEDEVNIETRAPRQKAVSGQADNEVPAHEGTVLALVDPRDFHLKHVRYLRRENGAWAERTWDEVIDAYDPEGIPRRAEKKANYLFHRDDWKYRPRRLRWESPVVGLHVRADGSSYVIEKMTRNFAWVRDARAPEIAAGRVMYKYSWP